MDGQRRQQHGLGRQIDGGLTAGTEAQLTSADRQWELNYQYLSVFISFSRLLDNRTDYVRNSAAVPEGGRVKTGLSSFPRWVARHHPRLSL
jgi:hypothetical protein